jgi:prephenate dehydrogenase
VNRWQVQGITSVAWKIIAMAFQHCGIIGLGLLGGSLALDLRREFPALRITGIARREQTLADAANLRVDDVPVFTHLATELAEVCTADLVVLCTPVQTIIQTLAALSPCLAHGALVTDVGSTKRAVMNAASTVLPPGVAFIGGHPMAGSDRAGLSHARAGLYRGATWALCVPPGQEAAAERLAALLARLGACPLPIAADVHDDLVALTSHLPHVVAAAVTNRVLGSLYGDAVLPFIAGGFRDTTRVAAANPAMWRDILLTNRDRVVAALDALLVELDGWRTAIRSGDAPHVEALLTTAHHRRERLNHD